MKSKIQNITPTYTKFENILPDELRHTQITEELEEAKNEINNIIEEDLRNIKGLSSSKNKAIPFNEFLKPPSIIKAAFYLENDDSQDSILFRYAHWTMSFSALRFLAQHIIEMSRELKTSYANYINASDRHQKGIEFNHFVRSYQDFNGYLISVYNTINQYYDLFVQVCNEIDPNNKEQTLTQFQSDIDYRELLSAIKELLLHGNMGRLLGFPLVRSALKIFITTELFNIRKSSKYSNNEIIFLKVRVPSLKAIIRIIEKLNLERSFNTDSLRRLYDWQSIVTHRGYRIDYLLWFISERTALEILAAFNA
ncbi:MAG: hypothetical protein JO297_03425, partial [Nitrososphaeraceae archaeon]|nr:hypothetical protein [Nitrososphaeraceae archaeon]